jgi:hypothetical protein
MPPGGLVDAACSLPTPDDYEALAGETAATAMPLGLAETTFKAMM